MCSALFYLRVYDVNKKLNFTVIGKCVSIEILIKFHVCQLFRLFRDPHHMSHLSRNRISPSTPAFKLPIYPLRPSNLDTPTALNDPARCDSRRCSESARRNGSRHRPHRLHRRLLGNHRKQARRRRRVEHDADGLSATPITSALRRQPPRRADIRGAALRTVMPRQFLSACSKSSIRAGIVSSSRTRRVAGTNRSQPTHH